MAIPFYQIDAFTSELFAGNAAGVCLLNEWLSALDCSAVIVTAPGRKSDFVSRFFAPGAGIPEDPVTGSAHCTFTPYWAKRLGKRDLHAFQLSKRGGELFCTDRGGRPLYVSAVDMDPQEAARHVQTMHGVHRIPTMLERADSLCRKAQRETTCGRTPSPQTSLIGRGARCPGRQYR